MVATQLGMQERTGLNFICAALFTIGNSCVKAQIWSTDFREIFIGTVKNMWLVDRFLARYGNLIESNHYDLLAVLRAFVTIVPLVPNSVL